METLQRLTRGLRHELRDVGNDLRQQGLVCVWGGGVTIVLWENMQQTNQGPVS